jgi:cyclic pyranopterin phosphate synthase
MKLISFSLEDIFMELKDKMGRTISYLRLSVTDRCNQRCIYCIPQEGIDFTSYENVLRLEELAGLAARFVELFDINKIRITGGEPLFRKNIEYLIEIISCIPHLKGIALTTNGSFLKDKAQALHKAGLKRINVSLDSLNPGKYNYVTGGGCLSDILEGLEAARDVGFDPIKINVVLLPGFNEASDFVEWGNREGYIVRFIEFMPPSCSTRVDIEGSGPVESDILRDLESSFGKVQPISIPDDTPGKTARSYGFVNNEMIFGVIPGTSEPFCSTCNRLRIDCQGSLRSCLYSTEELQLKNMLTASDEEFIKAVVEFVQRKTGRTLQHIGTNMSSIGG